MRRLLSLVVVGMLGIACTGITPGFTIPPINIPSFPPINLPSGLLPSSGACTLVTAAEVGGIMGTTPTLTTTEDGCSFTMPNFSTINVDIEPNSELSTSKILFGTTAKDITVGGLPAATGVFIGQPAVHVQRGTDQMQVLGILTGSDDATVAKLVQIATLAVSRWP